MLDKMVSTPGLGPALGQSSHFWQDFPHIPQPKKQADLVGGRAGPRHNGTNVRRRNSDLLIVFGVQCSAVLTGEIISHYISIEFNVCNLGLMMVCVLFVERRQLPGWWVVVGGGGWSPHQA